MCPSVYRACSRIYRLLSDVQFSSLLCSHKWAYDVVDWFWLKWIGCRVETALCMMLVCPPCYVMLMWCIQRVLSRCFPAILECVHKPDSGTGEPTVCLRSYTLVWTASRMVSANLTSMCGMHCNTFVAVAYAYHTHNAFATNHARLGLTTSQYVVHLCCHISHSCLTACTISLKYISTHK